MGGGGGGGGGGRSGDAKLLCKLSVLIWIIVGQGPTALAVLGDQPI